MRIQCQVRPRAEYLILRFGVRSVVEVEEGRKKKNQSRSVNKLMSSPGFLSRGVFPSCFPESSLTTESNPSDVLLLSVRLFGD